MSKKTLRGLHFQTNNPQGKFISVIKGEIFDVIIDLRKNSKTFCQSFSINLEKRIVNHFTFHQDLHMVFYL